MILFWSSVLRFPAPPIAALSCARVASAVDELAAITVPSCAFAVRAAFAAVFKLLIAVWAAVTFAAISAAFPAAMAATRSVRAVRAALRLSVSVVSAARAATSAFEMFVNCSLVSVPESRSA